MPHRPALAHDVFGPVARLFTGELTAGEHSFVWDIPPGLTDGMYDCVVSMGGQISE